MDSNFRLKAEKRPQKFKEIEDSALITVYLGILCSLCEILESRKNKQDFKLLNVETWNFVYLLLCTFGLGAIHESRLFLYVQALLLVSICMV